MGLQGKLFFCAGLQGKLIMHTKKKKSIPPVHSAAAAAASSNSSSTFPLPLATTYPTPILAPSAAPRPRIKHWGFLTGKGASF